MRSERTRFLIVGGGITNLAFAAALKSRDYLLCEAEAELGGYCRTVHQDGFVWDYSGHFFHFRHPEIEDLLVSRIGPQKVRRVVKDSRIHWGDRSIEFPFQKNIHQLPQQDFLECLAGLFERPEGQPQNFAQMLYAKFGKGIADRFLVPYNEKLYATDLNLLDPGAMGRFFPYADVPDIIRGFVRSDNTSYNSTFTYPEGGAMEYVKAIAMDVLPDRIQLETRITGLDLARKVAFTDHAEIQFEHLMSAMPFPRLLELSGLEFDRSVYSYNKVLVFNLGFDRKGPPGVHWIYYPQRELCFYRVGFYDNIFDAPRMSLYVEIGYPGSATLTPSEIAGMRERVLADLERVGVVNGHELVSHHSVLLDPAYVHITRDSIREVERMKAILATRGVYSMGRYGSWTYCSIEDNIVEARELAARFNAVA